MSQSNKIKNIPKHVGIIINGNEKWSKERNLPIIDGFRVSYNNIRKIPPYFFSKGVKTISITDKTGSLVSIKNVTDEDDLMIINKSGIAIRMAVEDLRVMGRATQGVKLINLKGNDSIAAVAKVMKEDEEEIIEDINAEVKNLSLGIK